MRASPVSIGEDSTSPAKDHGRRAVGGSLVIIGGADDELELLKPTTEDRKIEQSVARR